ncbi:MAG: hypothetical protein KJ645_11460 [Planctomycetes bacterium]|nr:hypothetical protein [Planctomycetota bacterium]
MVSFEIINWRTTITELTNYIDNVHMTAQTYTFEALTREIDTYVGGTNQFELTAGPAYANKWYIILQGVSGFDPGFNMNGGTVHVPLNLDDWTWFALSLNPYWTGFYGQLDAQGESSATFSSFGPQPLMFGYAVNFTYMILQTPTGTPIFASNPISVLFTAP